LFPKIVGSGTVLGPIKQTDQTRSTISIPKVVATCSHDTAAAIASVPAEGGESWAYLSSGTWSILGAELDSPCLSPEALAAGFTHEIGMDGAMLLSKNIVGLWIIQECARFWQEQGTTYTYEDLSQMAVAAGSGTAFLHLEDQRFVGPGKMPEKIAVFCQETNQEVPPKSGTIYTTGSRKPCALLCPDIAATYGNHRSSLRGALPCGWRKSKRASESTYCKRHERSRRDRPRRGHGSRQHLDPSQSAWSHQIGRGSSIRRRKILSHAPVSTLGPFHRSSEASFDRLFAADPAVVS
jgi:hypothetical protein